MLTRTDAMVCDHIFRNKVDSSIIMRKCGLREFIARSIDHRFCGNVLDLPSIGGKSPPFIRYELHIAYVIFTQ